MISFLVQSFLVVIGGLSRNALHVAASCLACHSNVPMPAAQSPEPKPPTDSLRPLPLPAWPSTWRIIGKIAPDPHKSDPLIRASLYFCLRHLLAASGCSPVLGLPRDTFSVLVL